MNLINDFIGDCDNYKWVKYLSEVPKPERIPPVTCNMIGCSGNRKNLYEKKMSLDVLHCHTTREGGNTISIP